MLSPEDKKSSDNGEKDDPRPNNRDFRLWETFQKNGMLWLVNSNLHIFGWNIVIERDEDVIVDVFPIKTRNGGFSATTNKWGIRRISEYMKRTDELIKDLEDY